MHDLCHNEKMRLLSFGTPFAIDINMETNTHNKENIMEKEYYCVNCGDVRLQTICTCGGRVATGEEAKTLRLAEEASLDEENETSYFDGRMRSLE